MKNINIAIIGLGYVGLPLAIEFGKKYETLGFDLDELRVEELKNKNDKTLEVKSNSFETAIHLSFTTEIEMIKGCNTYIITVPTPIDKENNPDLSHVIDATKMIGSILKQDDLIIYESTVYPGLTEEICIPILEEESGLECNDGFLCGYSPERINPGDTKHTLTNIVKVTSGSNAIAAKKVDKLYSSIIKAGTFSAKNIKVAEAAKVIENTQRDINIALINEISQMFSHLDIDTQAVLEAAGTKWNFLNFQPGLVGGHCIGVDPYYLTYKASQIGYKSQVILAGRSINDGMAGFIANKSLKMLEENGKKISESNVLVMGISFKENCPDIRNSKAIDLVYLLENAGCMVDIYDPWVEFDKTKESLNINLLEYPNKGEYDLIIITTKHSQFAEFGINEIRTFNSENGLIYDLKSLFSEEEVDVRL
jgi:UDP-N-acetyl-D-glucosamine/UDP-N-acetyl-D-galactosamine dehydrogenase